MARKSNRIVERNMKAGRDSDCYGGSEECQGIKAGDRIAKVTGRRAWVCALCALDLIMPTLTPEEVNADRALAAVGHSFAQIQEGERVRGEYHGTPIRGTVTTARYRGGRGRTFMLYVEFDAPIALGVGHKELRDSCIITADCKYGTVGMEPDGSLTNVWARRDDGATDADHARTAVLMARRHVRTWTSARQREVKVPRPYGPGHLRRKGYAATRRMVAAAAQAYATALALLATIEAASEVCA